MKKLMGGLKGFKAQEFFLNHAEKLALGLVGLAVLLVIMQTDWSRTDKTPQAIKSKVAEAENRIQNSVWPQEQKASFTLVDFAGDAQRVRGPLNVTPYEYSTNMWWPLYRKQELAKEPELLAVLDLRADPGRVALPISKKQPADLLAGNPGGMEQAPPGGAPATAPIPKDFNDQFAPRNPTAGGMGAGAPGAPGGEFSPNAGIMADSPEMMAGVYGMEGGMPGMNSNLEARGERFIAVRGVWPLWQQLEKFQRALNLQTTNDARSYLQLIDFVLERQTAQAGSDPWTGAWEVVDITRAMEVLDEAADYDVDRLDPQILDPVITMPMPIREVGFWGNYATHPRIEQFTLPPAELAREVKLQEKLIQEYEKYRIEAEKRTSRQGGFSGRALNMRSMANEVYGSEHSGAFEQSIRTEMERDPTLRMQLPDLKSRLTAVGRLLLFRYLDFDVRPGYAYRYRVKLELRNPNFERPLDQVLTESVSQGLKRETPWSESSNPAVVPESVNYFLQDVDRDPANETRPITSRPLAKLDFFEWDATVGTMIRDTIEVKTFGQFLGETKKTLKLDVVKKTFKDTDVTFRADDMLLDAVPDLKVDPALNPDLKLPPALRGKVGMLPEAVFVDHTGTLIAMDKMTNRQKHQMLTTYVTSERAPWESIKNKEDTPAGGLLGGEMPGAYPGSPYDGIMTEDGMMAEQPRRRSRKPRQPPPAAGP